MRLSPKRSMRISGTQRFTVKICLEVGLPLKIEMTIRRISTRATTGRESNSRMKGVDLVNRINSIQSTAK